nr:8799_t:CDS:2 [Entrophospora candida]
MTSVTTQSRKEKSTKDTHKLEQWENDIEMNGPYPESREDPKNWSWKELGNEQHEEINAPDEILPTLTPQDSTPIEERYNVKKIDEIMTKIATDPIDNREDKNQKGKKEPIFVEKNDSGVAELI